MAAEPNFSVIVAVFDGACTLQRCIDSVAEQETGIGELIVMDGGSTDGTISILERNDAHIAYWESEPDRGICHAWNKAIGHASADWVVFLGADDRLAAQGTLSEAKNRLHALDQAVSIAYGRVELVDEDDRVIGTSGQPWTEASRAFYAHNTIPHQGVFHRRALLERLGGFDERFKILGDYELLIRAFKEHEPAFLDMTVARFFKGGWSEQASAMNLATHEAYRARYLNGLERWPEWAAPRVWRADAFELVRRVAGPEVARKLADRYHGRDDVERTGR